MSMHQSTQLKMQQEEYEIEVPISEPSENTLPSRLNSYLRN